MVEIKSGQSMKMVMSRLSIDLYSSAQSSGPIDRGPGTLLPPLDSLLDGNAPNPGAMKAIEAYLVLDVAHSFY